MNQARQSKVSRLLNVVGAEILKTILAEQAEEAKNEFFADLSPKKHEAYKITFLMILQEYRSLREHEEAKIRENWEAHFIHFHDEKLSKLKEDYMETASEIVAECGFDYVAANFISDSRDLEEIIDQAAKTYTAATIAYEEKQKVLEITLHSQLEDVVKTLNLLTANDTGAKRFKIETEQATFNIMLSEEIKCDCANCTQEAVVDKLMRVLNI